MELLDYKTENIPEHELYEELREGNYEPFLREEKREWIESNIKLLRETKGRTVMEGKSHLDGMLYPEKYRDKL